MKDMTIEDLNNKIDQRIDVLTREINQLRHEMSDKVHQITLTLIGVIVSIWAVTLITASALYIITR